MLNERIASHHAASTACCSPAQRRSVTTWRERAPRGTSLRRSSTVLGAGQEGKPKDAASLIGDIKLLSPEPSVSPRGYLATGCAPCMDGSLSVQIDEEQVVTKFVAETLLPTRHGQFRLRGYKHSIDGGKTFTEPTAIIAGVVEGQENVPVRVHDACYTSEVLGSLKCDCAEQLTLALRTVHRSPPGMVIYLQQEGRGIGLANKIAAYSLQEQGLDTVDANRALGLPDDCREYTSVRNILRDLNIKSIKLITNNPRKINQLTLLGIDITGRVPCLVEAGEFNQGYLDTKRDRMEHLLEDQWGQAAPSCFWNHDGEPRALATTAALPGAQVQAAGDRHSNGATLS